MMANDFLKILYQPNYIRVILFYIPTELNTSREGGPVDFEFSPGNDFDHFDYQGTTEKLYYDKIWQWKGIPADITFYGGIPRYDIDFTGVETSRANSLDV